jgi:hypothetical protein
MLLLDKAIFLQKTFFHSMYILVMSRTFLSRTLSTLEADHVWPQDQVRYDIVLVALKVRIGGDLRLDDVLLMDA